MRAIATLLSVGILATATPRVPPPPLSGDPTSIAALGDSITRAFNTGTIPFTDAAWDSWATGARPGLWSQYERLAARGDDIEGRAYNDARTGATVADLLRQARRANRQIVSYITILIGANDVCARSVDEMTDVAAFRARFAEAMRRISRGSPRARILVLSIPDVYRLWVLFHDDLWARLAWKAFDVCRSLLAGPRSTDPIDVARRTAVRRRTLDLNRELESVCARFIHCRFDAGAVFADPFTQADVSHRDYFHPSLEGQARLAAVSWTATFDFDDQDPPISSASLSATRRGSDVTLRATDDAGVSGIEYRVDASRFRRYDGPFALRSGRELRFRAVDVNGNVEATNVIDG
jgi:lysophospholipase L1-like esterase